MSNIYLVGFMGTGKSIVGRQLAYQLKRKFIDIDKLIELREKRQISEIFAKEGEPYFREIEKNILEAASIKDNFIVACGGGIVIEPDNIRIMKQTGKIICLTAKPEVILKRIQGHLHRPLLNVDNPNQKIEKLLEKRAPFYAQSDVTIDTTELAISRVVDEIIKIIL